MQKKRSGNEAPLSKDEFVDIIHRLQEASELVDKVEELFRNSRENIDCDFCNGARLQISHEGIVVRLLEKLMHDDAEIICHFIYELEYGKAYTQGCVMDGDREIDISTEEKLYEYLIEKYRFINKEEEC